MIFVYTIFILIENYHVIFPFDDELYLFIQAGTALLFGAIGIVLGVGIFRLKEHVGAIAALAGIFEIIIALLFLTILGWFIALLLLIPAVILEIALLYKVSEGLPSASVKSI